MRVLDLLRKAAKVLEAAGIDDALPDAETIVFHVAGMDRLAAYIDNPDISPAASARVTRLLKRRTAGEPVQYITGHIDFVGLDLHVGKGVLIPRPETELLVAEVVHIAEQGDLTCGSSGDVLRAASCTAGAARHDPLSILDLCTGSGCIALALAKKLPWCLVTGTDLSKRALSFARKNARENGIRNVSFLEGSLFGPVKRRKFDIITANPPYIRTEELGTLQREVRDWEPEAALDGGEDGMDFYRQILPAAGEHLNRGGHIFLELGYDQAETVKLLAAENGFRNGIVVKDYAGIGRILKAMR